MADSSPLPDLLDRAEKAFELAYNLGSALYDMLRSEAPFDRSRWEAHAGAFQELLDALKDLRGEMATLTDGFKAVAEQSAL